LIIARQRGLLSRRSPSSMLKVQKRTLPWGWYFMGFAMGRESEVGEESCVCGGEEKKTGGNGG
jgi:hypothetical protein